MWVARVWNCLVLLAVITFSGCHAVLCKVQEPVATPPAGSNFSWTLLSGSTFYVDLTFPYESYLVPPPDKNNATRYQQTPPNNTWILLGDATQTQLTAWQSWWANSTAGTQALFQILAENDLYVNGLRNVTKRTGGTIPRNTIRLYFNTPANFTRYRHFYIVPGGVAPRWQGKILTAANVIDNNPYRPQFRDVYAPYWLVNTPYSGVICNYNSQPWVMPAYSACEDINSRPLLQLESYNLNLTNLAFSYNASTKELSVAFSARSSGNRTIDFSAPVSVIGYPYPMKVSGAQSINITKGDAYITAPLNQTGEKVHAIENLASPNWDVPATIVEQDSAVLLQDIATQIGRPGAALRTYWQLKNGTVYYNDSWSTMFDIEKMYSYAWFQITNDPTGYYDLFYMNGTWYRQYSLYAVYNTDGTVQNYFSTKAMHGCVACSWRNWITLFMDLFHYMFHNRADVYYVYRMTAGAWTQDHRLSIKVTRSSGASDTIYIARNISSFANSSNAQFQARAYGLDEDVFWSWAYNGGRTQFAVLEHRNIYSGQPTGEPLLFVNQTVANKSLSCGGLFSDEAKIFNASMDICWDAIDGCLQNNPVTLRRSAYYYYPYADTRADGMDRGYISANMFGPTRLRTRIVSGKLVSEWRGTNAQVDWTTIVKIPNITLS